MANEELDIKIAHLQMVQGVIGRMASDSQTLKTLAITVAAAIIALAQTTGGVTPWLALMGILPTLIFWCLTARSLHVERAYRHLYDIIRKDGSAEQFVMDWKPYKSDVSNPLKLAFTPSVLLPYGGVVVILVGVAVVAWGGGVQSKGNDVHEQSITQTK